jgi:hypothetical protein
VRDRKPERVRINGASSVFTKSVSILGDGGIFRRGSLDVDFNMTGVSLITDIVGVVNKTFCRLRIIRIRMVYI